MIKYKQNFKVAYYESDKEGKLSPTSLLKYLGEVSMIHNALLVDLKEMEKLNYGWMLNRWKVKIDKYPKAEESIKIESWISEVDKFYAYREFIIYDEENFKIGEATAIWIFIDMNRKRPIRIKSDYYNMDNIFKSKIFRQFHRFKPNIEIDNSIEFSIRRSDIDYNNHVNNVKYLEWIVESIPDEINEKYILNEFEILYKKEIKYPDSIFSGSKEITRLEDSLSYTHRIMNKDFNEEKTLGITKWIKK